MPGSDFTFRDAVKADSPAIKALVHAVLIEYGLTPEPERTDADLVDVVASYADRGGRFLVIVDAAGAIVGCGGLYPMDDEEVEIRKMYLDKSVRGKGLGRRMLETLIEDARTRGVKCISLETASVLHEAIALYRSRGFEPVEHSGKTARCDQSFVLRLQD